MVDLAFAPPRPDRTWPIVSGCGSLDADGHWTVRVCCCVEAEVPEFGPLVAGCGPCLARDGVPGLHRIRSAIGCG